MSRGLAMYDSLLTHCTDFHLYVVAFDDVVIHVLNKLKLEKISIISLKEFEDIHLLNIKPSRSYVEYMWTCTPSVILYCIKEFNLDHCTYLDADLYFFDNPEKLLVEANTSSILLSKHNYTPRYDKSNLSGIYCVQFMLFRNTTYGMRTLNWWRNACIDWCYNRYENGKFGDQKYLDDWTERFEGVHVLEHLGGGVAPWNVQQYTLVSSHSKNNETVSSPIRLLWSCQAKAQSIKENEFEIIFFHFHYFRFLSEMKVDLGTFQIDKEIIQQIYVPYILHLLRIGKLIQEVSPDILTHGKYAQIKWYKIITRYLRSGFKLNYNIFKINDLIQKQNT